jgi:hypothetical protein
VIVPDGCVEGVFAGEMDMPFNRGRWRVRHRLKRDIRPL